MRRFVVLCGAFGCLGLAAACRQEEGPTAPPGADPNVVDQTSADQTKGPILDNGLDETLRHRLYATSMGSDLFPLAVLQNLKSADGRPFLENMERFGFIPYSRGPEGLPIGLTLNNTPRGLSIPMVGINCAACHVGQITFRGKSLQVDGAPNMFDLNGFYSEFFQQIENQPQVAGTLLGPLLQSIATTSDEKAAELFSKLAQFIGQQENELTDLERDAVGKVRGLLERMREEARTLVTEQAGQPQMDYQDIARKLLSRVPAELEAAATALDQAREAGSSEIAALGDQAAAVKARVSGLFAQTGLVQFLRAAASARASNPPPAANAGASPTENSELLDLALLHARVRYIASLKQLRDFEKQKSTTSPGPGRIDAFSGIRDLVFPDPIPPTSPVSYPPMWKIQQLDYFHWDGNTNSVLQRNVGQAVGMGAVYDPVTYHSAVIAPNLHDLEVTLWKLRPPAWPSDLLGKLEPELIKRGEEVFRETCSSCHAPVAEIDAALEKYARDPSGTAPVVTRLYSPEEVGTDPERIKNYQIPVNRQKQGEDWVGGDDFTESLHTVAGKLTDAAFADSGLPPESRAELEPAKVVWRNTKSYVARPLWGIWATAPYLHNASVPTLADLLQPVDQRPKTFSVGYREFDLDRVGYVTREADIPKELRDRPPIFRFDTGIKGNGNQGHTYDVDLTDADKRALLEFLKTQ